MAVYMITYDIKVADNFEYPKLYEAIKGISGIWCHPVESVWFVDTVRFSETDIMNKLKPFLTIRSHNGDRILINRCTKSNSGWFSKDCVDWFNSQNRTWTNPPY